MQIAPEDLRVGSRVHIEFMVTAVDPGTGDLTLNTISTGDDSTVTGAGTFSPSGDFSGHVGDMTGRTIACLAQLFEPGDLVANQQLDNTVMVVQRMADDGQGVIVDAGGQVTYPSSDLILVGHLDLASLDMPS